MEPARLRAVCLSQRRTDPKVSVPGAELRPDWGVLGDAHAGSRQPGRWQVSLLAWEEMNHLNTVEGLDAVPGSFAENLSTERPEQPPRILANPFAEGGGVETDVPGEFFPRLGVKLEGEERAIL